MRRDLASAAVIVTLRGLKMYGMAQAVRDLIEQGAPASDTAVPILPAAQSRDERVRGVLHRLSDQEGLAPYSATHAIDEPAIDDFSEAIPSFPIEAALPASEKTKAAFQNSVSFHASYFEIANPRSRQGLPSF